MIPSDLAPMLATTGDVPEGDDWAHEVKWDGVRALLAVGPEGARATSRQGNDVSGGYPELRAVAGPPALLDAELVCLVAGVPDFGALQERMHVRSPSAQLLAARPVTVVVFDLLHDGHRSLLQEPYDTRRAALAELELPAVQVPDAFDDGPALWETTLAAGLEGVVSKRRSSRYLPGQRSTDWVKSKHLLRQSAVVCGWKAGEGGRSGRLGSLLLGVHRDEGLSFAGHVGTGFTAATLRRFAELLDPLGVERSPYDVEVPREHARTAHWTRPVLVVDVEHRGWTRDGRLRQPAYKGLRDDLDPAEVVAE